MRAPLFLIGAGAGLASALLYASAASGSPLAIVLFYVAPLPILLAGLGWRHHAGLVAAAVAALAVAAGVGPSAGLFHVVAVGLPAWWLAYLTLLARPGATEAATEWFPIGRLVIWCAAIGGTLVAASVFLVAGSLEEYRAALRTMLERVFSGGAPGGAPTLPGGQDPAAFVELLTVALPIMAASLWTLTSIFNLWLAGRITRASGRLTRPWPSLPDTVLPRGAGLALGAATAGSLLPGLPGLFAEMFAATFLAAFALLGLAVLHVTTRALPTRSFILFGVYAVLVVQPWVGVFLALLGVAEQTIGVRKRFGSPPGPPPTAPAALP